jgi:hypothetical protein
MTTPVHIRSHQGNQGGVQVRVVIGGAGSSPLPPGPQVPPGKRVAPLGTVLLGDGHYRLTTGAGTLSLLIVDAGVYRWCLRNTDIPGWGLGNFSVEKIGSLPASRRQDLLLAHRVNPAAYIGADAEMTSVSALNPMGSLAQFVVTGDAGKRAWVNREAGAEAGQVVESWVVESGFSPRASPAWSAAAAVKVAPIQWLADATAAAGADASFFVTNPRFGAVL